MAELLAPAGNPEALDAAIHEGADAVYLGLKSFNARMRSSNFAWSQFEATCDALHRKGKKVFVTVNTVLTDSETERMYRFLAYLDRVGPDALIVQDFGLVRMIREYFPKLKIHASTQMNIACARAVNTMSRSGISRVVLSRELGLDEVRQIRERTSCELEVFVHGALCVSQSGLCLFSSFLGGKSANRGLCAQACRRLYNAEEESGITQGYYFSPLDLQLIDYIPDLVQAGVHSFKIEGRMKSAEYVGSVVSAYRYVLDNWETGRKAAVETARRILANDFARGKTAYWYDVPSIENAGSKVLKPDQAGGTGIALGTIDKVRTSADLRLGSLTKGSYEPEIGDSLRFHKKDDTGRTSHKVQVVESTQGRIWIDLPENHGSGDPVYLIQTKTMTRRYPRILPGDLSPYNRQPHGEKLPPLSLTPPVLSAGGGKAKLGRSLESVFPEGIYVQVSSMEDLYQSLTDRPVRAIVELNSETASGLCAVNPDNALPYSRRELIISLDPFLPQALEDELATRLDSLVDFGYINFIVNNPGHIAMLRNRELNLVAGPWLYSFNRWSVAWLFDQGLYDFITPFENFRDNLEETVDVSVRPHAWVTVFAYPSLFRIRFRLPKTYSFSLFSDRQNGMFRALSTDGGSFVLPEEPFSIVDRGPALTKSGFSRQIVDLSKVHLSRQMYRQIMDALRKGQVLPNTGRFNWKDGFYDPDRVEELKGMAERSKDDKRRGTVQIKTGSKTATNTKVAKINAEKNHQSCPSSKGKPCGSSIGRRAGSVRDRQGSRPTDRGRRP